MVKYLLLSVNILTCYIVFFFGGEKVNITHKFPKEVTAGESFIMEVTINKGDISEFAQFKQELPKGFTAKAIEIHGADFKFIDQFVRFTWSSLPDTSVFTISYEIHVDSTISGYFPISGRFSYIDKNKEASAVPYSDWSTVFVRNGKYPYSNDSISLAPTPDKSNVSSFRSRSHLTGNDIKVELSINSTTSNFARIVETIPEGYAAGMIESNNGIFTFSEGKVKFLWLEIPSSSQFKVSYKLSPTGSTVSDINAPISGWFFYLSNGRTDSIAIQDNGMVTVATEKTAMENNDGKSTGSEQVPANTENVMPERTASDVSYSVQICALKKYRTPDFFNKNEKYAVQDPVKQESHQGWNKYVVGTFSFYKEARDFRESLENSPTTLKAFVSAYNKSKRITVQEALMLANQKWYE